MNQILFPSELTHSIRNSVLSVIESLQYVEMQIKEHNIDEALETIRLIRELSPDIAEALSQLEVVLGNS